MTAAAPIFALDGISKGFPGVRALDGVSFDLKPGEVHALLGENGAGKSTLVKIMSGIHRPDSGSIRIDGAPVTIGDPAHALALGISPVHQELHLQPWLSVAENVFLGRQPRDRLGLIDRRRMERETAALLERLGVELDPRATVEDLSVAQRQIIVIARALSSTARIIIFDEPTSSLTERETALLFAIIARLREEGLGVIYISHRLEEIFRLCDRVTILRDGRWIATRPVADVDVAALIEMMIGRPMEAPPPRPAGRSAESVLRLTGVARAGLLDDIDLDLRRGEILGVAGLVGAGRTELARAIFGDLRRDRGEIRIDGRALSRHHGPKEAIEAGVGLVPEDRKEQGLVTGLSVGENIGMAVLPSLGRLGFLSPWREAALADSYIARLAIKTPGAYQKAAFLSGGNQQRVVIAKWLATKPKVLIVDEPTRGVDVGAMAGIHNLLRELAAAGVGVLMISSDMTEIVAVSHRVAVMHEGRIADVLEGDEIRSERIMALATGQRPQDGAQAGRAAGA